uniref:Interleukin 13 receptor, alpha 2 n=1 Tax=Erpetoichthys calabaricus TaxID=27687 RepID=A0A8C4X9R7_ERPCA
YSLNFPLSFLVGPPQNLQIIDHGHLGELHIQWQAPIFFKTEDECLLWYGLQYYSPDQKRWKVIGKQWRAFSESYSSFFEKLFTCITRVLLCILNGDCQISFTGNVDSKIRNMSCFYYNRERLECRWQKGNKVPSHGYNYYLHKKMDHALECSNYIKSDGYNIGCNFAGAYLIEFTDLNICVNGSSSHGNMRAAYFTYELQNIGKEDLILFFCLFLIHLEWSVASFKIPHHCLEYEAIFTDETKISLFNLRQWNSLCFRIRSKINMYCADNNIWSDWSPVKTECTMITDEKRKKITCSKICYSPRAKVCSAPRLSFFNL